MTDEQDGQPRRRAVDDPTVMGPSTGHLHGPAPAPTPAAARDATPAPQDEPAPADQAADATGPDAPAPHSDDPTPPRWPSNPTAQNGPTVADPAAARPSALPQDEPTLADRTGDATRPGASAPYHASADPTPTTAPPRWPGHPGAQVDEPTVAEPVWPTVPAAPPHDEPTIAEAAAWSDGPTVATPVDDPAPITASPPWPSNPGVHNDPAVADPVRPTAPAASPQEPAIAAWADGPTVATPVDDAVVDRADEPTMAVVDESPTTTGPTVAGWPLDELLPPPPTDLVWRPDVPEPPSPARRPGYYIALGASVVLVVALVAAAAFAAVVRPTRLVAGTARPTQAIPDITGSAPPPATTTVPPQTGPADHPLSTSTARMADTACALPRFDLADDRQAAFYAAAKVCADDAWRGVLDEAGLSAEVEVVTVTGAVRTTSCGEVTPASPATQCDGTVYMTPAHLRDTEQNGRYPGRYFGVFLREYARALQHTTGLVELASTLDGAETRLAQQATCMAGIASGAMANRGAVDANITGEISDRLSSVDAPPDAKALLDKGFEARTLGACSTW